MELHQGTIGSRPAARYDRALSSLAMNLPKDLPLHFLIAGVCLSLFAGCATTTLPPTEARHYAAAKQLHEARATRQPAEQRAAHYLEAAANAAPRLGVGAGEKEVRDIYNAATAELTVLLRSADDGRLWNRPLMLTANGATYRLGFAPASLQNSTWAPGYFDFFWTPKQVKEKSIRVQVRQSGLGGVLVGVHEPPNPEKVFLSQVGVAAPVTVILDFRKAAPGSNPVRDVILSLHDPTRRDTIRIAGATRPLAADFTAPLAYYPHPRFLGLMEMMRVDRYYHSAGLVMLQPYDPERIPVVFVHGLMSARGMWRDTIDAVESDPVLRGRFQFWAFGYPTGDPISLSALQFRESLAGVYRLYPRTKDMVLISHSLGGLLSKMQTITTDRAAWDATFGAEADQLYAKVPPENLVKRALIFDANPRVKRVVFICVPHRGSPLADGLIGSVGVSLIHLPMQVIDGIQTQLGHSLAVAGGRKGFVFPPSVHGLSARSPLLRALDTRPMRAPHHTIAGDRGRGDTPNSSDGVVEYRSSHLDSAHSELIVPGPHSSCQLPETVEELRRILHLHLKTAGRGVNKQNQ
jgi:pimeloyl-ACP methyl ester carboxylesterase